jgi:hypothetical protein
VLMGRNAYFAGPAGSPNLSPHANVEGACTGCHMTNNPDGQHVFTIDPLKKAEVCANCHGNTSGEALQGEVEMMLETLGTKMGNHVGDLIAGAPVNGDYYVRAWDETSDCYSAASCTSPTTLAPTNVHISGNAATSVAFTEIHGQGGVIITLTTPITWTKVGTGCSGDVTSNKIYAQLGSIRTALETCGGAKAPNVVPTTDVVIKAAWNYFLFEADSGKGIHNPSFAVDTLWNTINAVP